MTCPFLVVVWISARADVAQFSCWICPGNVTARRRQPTGRPCRAGLEAKNHLRLVLLHPIVQASNLLGEVDLMRLRGRV